jgi:ribonucleoside-diphosphate reductase alpha chain
MIEVGFLPSKERRQPMHAAQVVNLTPSPGRLPGPRLRQCPKCGEAALIRSENCDQCTSCDYSKCG